MTDNTTKKNPTNRGLISSIALFLGFTLIYYAVLLFLGGGVLSFLGLEYDNLFSLAKFLSLYFFITLPIDFILDIFFNIVKITKNISNIQHKLLYISVDIPLNMILLGFLESILNDVSCSMITAFLFCVVYSIVGLFLDD